MSKRKALWNRCPVETCRETALWMPYEERCGKCGYGGKPISTNQTTQTSETPCFVSLIWLVLGAALIIALFLAGRASVMFVPL